MDTVGPPLRDCVRSGELDGPAGQQLKCCRLHSSSMRMSTTDNTYVYIFICMVCVFMSLRWVCQHVAHIDSNSKIRSSLLICVYVFVYSHLLHAISVGLHMLVAACVCVWGCVCVCAAPSRSHHLSVFV